MFGERCYQHPNCGNSTNWTCACTCDEYIYYDAIVRKQGRELAGGEVSVAAQIPTGSNAEAKLEMLLCYVHHDVGCEANDLDPMDHSPCTCGLRAIHNPWGRKDDNYDQ